MLRRLFGPSPEQIRRQILIEQLLQEGVATLRKLDLVATAWAMRAGTKPDNPLAPLLGMLTQPKPPEPKD